MLKNLSHTVINLLCICCNIKTNILDDIKIIQLIFDCQGWITRFKMIHSAELVLLFKTNHLKSKVYLINKLIIFCTIYYSTVAKLVDLGFIFLFAI